MRASILTILTALALAPVALGQEPISYTRFLVPVYAVNVHGAHGSLWETQTWLRYSGTVEAHIVPRAFCFGVMCPLDGILQPNWPAVPFQYLAGFPETAILVHVDSRHASEVAFQSRVRDVSRSAETAGTEVPVVREDHIKNEPLYLLNVPVDVRFRDMLRIYALPEIAEPEVEIRYFRQTEDHGTRFSLAVTLLKSERLRLRTRHEFTPVQLFPSIAEVANFQAAPELAAEQTVWIEVVPITPGLRIWALASVTNNVTQEVTVISPSL